MGIYPTTKWEQQGEYLVQTYNGFDGAIVTTYYEPVLVIEERTTCYCCSCGDREGSDPWCRNHGYGFGERRCDVHNIPATTIDPDTDEPLTMRSVQEERYHDRWWSDRGWPSTHSYGTGLMNCSGDPHNHWPMEDPSLVFDLQVIA